MARERKKISVSPVLAVALGVLGVLLVGTFLLALPISTTGDGWGDFMTSFFTSVSATCVTGLSTVDVSEFYTLFGQIVLLVIIQLGGLGFITFISFFMVLLKRSTSLSDRKLIQQSSGGMYFDSLRAMMSTIFAGTFIVEFVGAILLSGAFIPDMGWGKGIWNGIFTSISAFCNAGFALTGNSLVPYASNPLVIITVVLLVLIGGLGFFVWYDIKQYKFKFKRYSLHTKLVLVSSAVLVFGGWILFGAFEWNNPETLGSMGTGSKILNALFLSVTPRTAGFNTVPYESLTNGGNVLNIIFMFIGGNSGSTAGGLKVTTITVLILAAIGTASRKEETVAFKKRIDGETIYEASAVLFIYIVAIVVGLLCLMAAEPDASFTAVLNEVVSAVCTVGLSANLTGNLCDFSLIVLCVLMFFGRVGGYTMMMIFLADRKSVIVNHPSEGILIG
ncbi:MAG: Trk family potassium uptake protein [Clostridia bacterium]|nr:Trk family potassium uptake protein [Clostridia bacterium]